MNGTSVIRKMVTPVVAAAGYGQIPEGRTKVLAELSPGKTLIRILIDSIYEAGMCEAVVILNPDSVDKVRPFLPNDVKIVIQETRKGTAQAVKLALEHGVKKHIMTFFADMPLWRPETLFNFAKTHLMSGKKMTLMSIPEEIWTDDDTRRYGRIAKDVEGNILGIFEPNDGLPESTEITTVNPSLFCFCREALMPAIRSIKCVTCNGEKTINAAIYHFLKDGGINEVFLSDPTEALGVNDADQLEYVQKVFQGRSLVKN